MSRGFANIFKKIYNKKEPL